MRTGLTRTAAAMILAACMSSAFAAESVNLTDQQKQSIQHGLASLPAQSLPGGFAAQLGGKVPSSVTLKKLPSDLAQQVPSVKNDEFAKFTNNEIVIVNPSSKKIVAIIGQSSTTGAKAGSMLQSAPSSNASTPGKAR